MANKKLTDVSSATSLSSIFVNADGSVKQIDIETLKQLLGIVEYSLPKAGTGSFGERLTSIENLISTSVNEVAALIGGDA